MTAGPKNSSEISPAIWRESAGKKGRELYLAGAHFEAHEAWEEGWTRLPLPWRSEVKAWIQVCGVLVHVKNGKMDPATRLIKRAIELLTEASAHRQLQKVESLTDERILLELEERLLRLLAACEIGSSEVAAACALELSQVRPTFRSEGKWLI